MHTDARDLPVSAHSSQAAAAFDHLIVGYLTQRADAGARMTAVLEVDPDFALGHCMKGYFGMLAFKQDSVAGARCEDCHHERLVAFSCKRRGICPSCGAIRLDDCYAG